ncbi:exodeoxyribonuclease VII large subunit, partial [Clostridium sp.]|uniref:exodeoxyribonuclease VII large subunit n=1 Tax=Clostridium sp. TaxID=1506 RepID=UPI003F7E1ECA
KNVDLIIIGRGGGSIEELWNFNEEALAEEIFHSEIPIISAVGHEVDYTIADFVADLRASTPSQAGELAVTLDSEIYSAISEYENYLNKYMIERFNDEKSKINNFSKILSLNSPMNKVVNSYLEIEKAKEKLDSLLNKKIALEKQKLISLNNVLQAHSPLNILSKGYA